jgi:beta-glucosidase-like glycosyl hydrolase
MPPTIDVSKRELLEADLLPFRAAIDAGVATMMAANVAYPALDASGAPAVRSREILQWFLRQQLRFDGLIVADTAGLERTSAGDEDPVVAAINAGCDVFLCADDLEELVARLKRALERHELREENVQQSVRRRLKWAQWASPPNEWRKPSAADVAWGAQLADRVVRMVRGVRPPLHAPLDVIVVNERADMSRAIASEPFLDALRGAGWEARRVDALADGAGSERSAVVLVFGETAAAEPHRAGYSAATRAAVDRACAAAPGVLVMQFGHPRLIRDLPGATAIATAWSGDPAMQQAAARWIAGQGTRG